MRILTRAARRLAVAAVLAAALALSPRPALGWNRAAHMVSGAMAYRDLLARDPQAVARVVAILRQHPDYERQWLPYIRESRRPHDEMLFAMAARWPDDVRRDPNFHRGAWHYVNLPLVPPDDTTRPPAAPAGEILTAIPRTLAALRDAGTPDPQKAFALCWLFHLVGDIHQPLHAANLFSVRWPEGDRGGNLFWVKPGVTERPVNLHSYWDDVVVADDQAQARPMAQAADRLTRAYPRDALEGEIAQRDPIVWARDEGLPLARSAAYRNFTMPGVADTSSRVPVVPAGYLAASRKVAERRLVLAAYRLSAALSEALTLGS